MLYIFQTLPQIKDQLLHIIQYKINFKNMKIGTYKIHKINAGFILIK